MQYSAQTCYQVGATPRIPAYVFFAALAALAVWAALIAFCCFSALDPFFTFTVTSTRISEMLAHSGSHKNATVPPLRLRMGTVKFMSPTQT